MHGLAKPAATTTIPALRAEAADIHKRAQALSTERAELALPSILGDSKAKARIEAIDDERTVLAARVETIEAAIRTLQKTEQQASWRKRLPALERALQAELVDHYRNWSKRLDRVMLGRQSHDLRDLKFALEELNRIEHDAARMLADRMLAEARLPFHNAGDQDALIRARKEHAKLIEQRTAQVNEAVAEMLASNTAKRPAALTEAIAAAQQRIAVGG